MTDPVRARDDWTLVLDGFDPADEGRREALCTLGNGYQAVRGAVPESEAGGAHYPGTYAAGVFNRLRDEVGGSVVETESVVNLPNWLVVRMAVDGLWVDPLDPAHLLEHRVTLDMRRGLLSRVLRFADAAGRRTAVRQRRFVHMGCRHLAGLQTVVTPENWSGRLRVRSGLDGRIINSGVARYRDMAGRHLRVATADEVDPETLLLVARTTQSELLVAEAARTRVDGAEDSGTGRRTVRERGRISHDLELEVAEGRAVTVEKIVALVTSRDVAISHPALTAVEQLAEAPCFQTLLTSHELAWDQLWRRFRVDLADGRGSATAETLRTLRLGLFHVLQTVSPHDLDLDAGIPARGLHGEAYRGHVFWDELFVLPVLTLRMPQLTRALLHYRVRRLDAARRAARLAGHRGAMYPWQSGSDGREESQRVHLNPRSGRWLPDTSHLQRHVGLAVAYDVWQYYQATGDLDFLAGHGAEVLLEVARFFADLARHDPAMDRYRIRGVMGPDEYSTRYPGAAEPGIDDNAYTNVMAVWLWHRARDTLAVLPSTRRAELVERLGLTPAELLHWEDLCRRMYVPFRDDGVLEQFHGASRLPELDWAGYRRRYGDLQRLDRILEAEGLSVDDYQATKQADALMLFYLLSADELRELLGGLGYALPPEAIPRTIDHHLAHTVHGSTLSALVHAWVLARAHREDALDHFERALRSDLADVQGGTTAEGVHLGAMAGSVDLLQRCFAGLETRADALWFNPHWPERFGALEFSVEYRGVTLEVRVSGREVRVAAAPGPGSPVRVGCGEEVRLLRTGEALRFVAVSGAAGLPVTPDPATVPAGSGRPRSTGRAEAAGRMRRSP
ncbi:glycosyl hydrolase family 65 protein [Pseudonocardia sp. NPDC049154]|uniref:glycoside hydrolase family 65 protein n=1 Tax=Pseudonocardia sp. NPDC049154 TaxID=3155501 RepID=UPI0033DB5F16